MTKKFQTLPYRAYKLTVTYFKVFLDEGKGEISLIIASNKITLKQRHIPSSIIIKYSL